MTAAGDDLHAALDALDRRVEEAQQTPDLTDAQRRILVDVIRDGRRVYNGIARRPVKALEARGLVHVEWDHVAHAKGSGIDLTQHITVTPRP